MKKFSLADMNCFTNDKNTKVLKTSPGNWICKTKSHSEDLTGYAELTAGICLLVEQFKWNKG